MTVLVYGSHSAAQSARALDLVVQLDCFDTSRFLVSLTLAFPSCFAFVHPRVTLLPHNILIAACAGPSRFIIFGSHRFVPTNQNSNCPPPPHSSPHRCLPCSVVIPPLDWNNWFFSDVPLPLTLHHTISIPYVTVLPLMLFPYLSTLVASTRRILHWNCIA
jgi:hypothetical protein